MDVSEIKMDSEKEALLSGRTGVTADTRVGRMMTSHEYEPTEEDKSYKGWKHFIPFRPAST